jgi:hypothetical protein
MEVIKSPYLVYKQQSTSFSSRGDSNNENVQPKNSNDNIDDNNNNNNSNEQ